MKKSEKKTLTLEEIEKEFEKKYNWLWHDLDRCWRCDGKSGSDWEKIKSFYRKHIIKIMESIVPKKKTWRCHNIPERNLEEIGFNDCINEILENIKKIK